MQAQVYIQVICHSPTRAIPAPVKTRAVQELPLPTPHLTPQGEVD